MKNIYKYSLINYIFNMAPFLSTMLTFMLTYLAFYIIIHTIKKVIVLFNKTYNNIINYIENINIDFITDIMIYVILISYTIYMIYISLTNSLDLLTQVIKSDDIILNSTLLTSIKGFFKGKIKQVEYTYKSDITPEEYQQIYNLTFGSKPVEQLISINKNDEDFELICETIQGNTLDKLLANDPEYLESKIDINNSTGLEKLVKFINFKLNYHNDSFNSTDKPNKTFNDLLSESFSVEQLVENTIDNLDGNNNLNLLKELQDIFNVSISLSIFALPKTMVNKIKDLFCKESNIRQADEETLNDIWDNNSNQTHMRRWKTYDPDESKKRLGKVFIDENGKYIPDIKNDKEENETLWKKIFNWNTNNKDSIVESELDENTVFLNLLRQKGEIDKYNGMDLSPKRLREIYKFYKEDLLKNKQYQRLPEIPLDTDKRLPAPPMPNWSSMSSQEDEEELWNFSKNTLNDYLTRSKLSLEDSMFRLNKQYFGVRNFNDPLSTIQESDYDSLSERINSNLRNTIEASSFATKNSKIKELFFKRIKLLFKFLFKYLVRKLTMFIIIYISSYLFSNIEFLSQILYYIDNIKLFITNNLDIILNIIKEYIKLWK